MEKGTSQQDNSFEILMTNIEECERECYKLKHKHKDIISFKHIVEKYEPTKVYYDTYLNLVKTILKLKQAMLDSDWENRTKFELRIIKGISFVKIDGDYFLVLEDRLVKGFISELAEECGFPMYDLLVYTLDTCAPAIMDLLNAGLPMMSQIISIESLENTLVRDSRFEDYVKHYNKKHHPSLHPNQTPISYFLTHHVDLQSRFDKAANRCRPLWGVLCRAPENGWPKLLAEFAQLAWPYQPFADILWEQEQWVKPEYYRKKRAWCFAAAFTHLLHQKYPDLRDTGRLDPKVCQHNLKVDLRQIWNDGLINLDNLANSNEINGGIFEDYYYYYEVPVLFNMIQQDPYSILSIPDFKIEG